MVQEQDADGSAPKQAGEASDDRARERDPEAEGEREPEQHPEQERTVDEADRRVGDQVLGVAVWIRAVDAAKHPSDMGVKQAARSLLASRRCDRRAGCVGHRDGR